MLPGANIQKDLIRTDVDVSMIAIIVMQKVF